MQTAMQWLSHRQLLHFGGSGILENPTLFLKVVMAQNSRLKNAEGLEMGQGGEMIGQLADVLERLCIEVRRQRAHENLLKSLI